MCAESNEQTVVLSIVFILTSIIMVSLGATFGWKRDRLRHGLLPPAPDPTPPDERDKLRTVPVNTQHTPREYPKYPIPINTPYTPKCKCTCNSEKSYRLFGSIPPPRRKRTNETK